MLRVVLANLFLVNKKYANQSEIKGTVGYTHDSINFYGSVPPMPW